MLVDLSEQEIAVLRAILQRAEAKSETTSNCLVTDIFVSETSLVVKGTWVTVDHVIDLITDGWTWSDILRTHPELTVDDIRACLEHAVAEGVAL